MYRKQLEDSFTLCTCCNKAITVESYEDEVVLCLWIVYGGFYEMGSTFWARLALAWRALWRGFGFVGDMHFDDVDRLNKFIGLLEEAKVKMVEERLRVSRSIRLRDSKYVRGGKYEFVVLHPKHPTRKERFVSVYAIRLAESKGTWDHEADLIDGLVPMTEGDIYRAFNDKNFALKVMGEMNKKEFEKPNVLPEIQIYTGIEGKVE